MKDRAINSNYSQTQESVPRSCATVLNEVFNLLDPELFFLFLAHSVYKMWIIQEPNTKELWNKLHFEEEKTESTYHV
jgi:hypothetical protein